MDNKISKPYIGKLKQVWHTRELTITKKIDKDTTVSIGSKIGLSVDVGIRDENISTNDIYEGTNQTLNILMETEKQNFINAEVTTEFVDVYTDKIKEIKSTKTKVKKNAGKEQ